jgi:NTP pyrophosphatase (non-canonical NTP hydrolase)
MKYENNLLIEKICQWHKDRNLIDGSTDKDQVLKLQQELGELSDSVCKGKDMKDDLGDMLVVMINIMARNKITMEECLETAYNDIKHRKGRMVDGIFVKAQAPEQTTSFGQTLNTMIGVDV